MENPALNELVRRIDPDFAFVEVSIFRQESGFVLRHQEDRGLDEASLRILSLPELRHLAMFTREGIFRPLRCAPGLQKGWRLRVSSEKELAEALWLIYPGALGDWLAGLSEKPPITHFREHAARQTGRLASNQSATYSQLMEVICRICDANHCLKRRLWTVAGLNGESAGTKSCVPCFEPCAWLVEALKKNVGKNDPGQPAD